MDNVSSVVVNQKMFGMLAEMQIKTNDPERYRRKDKYGYIYGIKGRKQ